MAQPKWVTPDRQNHLVSIFVRSRGFCVFGHPHCPYPEHYYEIYIEGLIEDWKAQDRADASAQWLEEQRRMHSLAERSYPIRGQFNSISKDIYFAKQPLFYLLGMSISGLTFTPFAKVRIASSFVHLYVDLGDRLRGVSKNKRRKAIRYGKALPIEIEREVDAVCRLAVRHYLNF
ncbi:MAG: hypothetical protein D4S01_06455 [Dehalococcoidia bacterium]|nr:MAG: hypothetical protein D4S01_06455 [Dehalococcoidia bacterium]